jgi:hypothetical protein
MGSVDMNGRPRNEAISMTLTQRLRFQHLKHNVTTSNLINPQLRYKEYGDPFGMSGASDGVVQRGRNTASFGTLISIYEALRGREKACYSCLIFISPLLLFFLKISQTLCVCCE